MYGDEKLTEKKHIRLTPELTKEVEHQAYENRRHFQDELRVLVEEALHARREVVKGNSGPKRRLMTADAARRRTEGAA